MLSLVSPLLAVILGFFSKYVSGDDTNPHRYIFSQNENLPAFLFMSVVVAIFLGLIIAAEEIIKATQNGLWLKGVTGYGINPVNGNFSGGVSGFWIENGKVVFPVKGLTIAGTAEEMLIGIDMLGNDLDLNRSFTAPTIRIKEMQIGGE